MLQTEVTKLKELLERILNDISVNLAPDLRTEVQTVVDMPEVLSPGRLFLQPASN